MLRSLTKPILFFMNPKIIGLMIAAKM